MELYTNFQLALANGRDKNTFTFIAVIFIDGENMKYKLRHYTCRFICIYICIYNAEKWTTTGKINCFPLKLIYQSLKINVSVNRP